jgi:hypothetical protein
MAADLSSGKTGTGHDEDQSDANFQDKISRVFSGQLRVI